MERLRFKMIHPEQITQAEELIATIDEHLVLVEPLDLHKRLRYGVCHVRERGCDRDLVLRWEVPHNRLVIDNAARVLRETAHREDTPELVRTYDAEYVTLLKTYVQGTPLDEMLEGIMEFYDPTKSIVTEFHEKGIAGVDPRLDNLLCHEGKIRLFDFNDVDFQDQNRGAYYRKVRSDLLTLKMAFGISE